MPVPNNTERGDEEREFNRHVEHADIDPSSKLSTLADEFTVSERPSELTKAVHFCQYSGHSSPRGHRNPSTNRLVTTHTAEAPTKSHATVLCAWSGASQRKKRAQQAFEKKRITM